MGGGSQKIEENKFLLRLRKGKVSCRKYSGGRGREREKKKKKRESDRLLRRGLRPRRPRVRTSRRRNRLCRPSPTSPPAPARNPAPTPSSTTGVRRHRCCLSPAAVRSQQLPDPLSLRLRPCSEPDLLHRNAGLALDSSATCGSADPEPARFRRTSVRYFPDSRPSRSRAGFSLPCS